MAEPIEESIPSERVATLMAQPHGDLSDAAEQLAALVTAASAELLDVICAIDRKQSWTDDGATSPEAWVVGMLRTSYATSREWVRVARALDHLPQVREAFSEGMLSWDQVRHATVFVVPEDDEAAALDLPGHSAAQLEQMAKMHRRRTRRDAERDKHRRSFSWRKSTDGDGWTYRGFLPADEGAILNAALEQRAERAGPNPENGLWDPAPMRQADALVDLARNEVLDNPGPDPTVVVVHVDADVVDGAIAGNGSIDDIPIPVDSVLRLLCDCKVEYSVDGPGGTCIGIGRADRSQPHWMRRRLTYRDSTCRFPGCGRPIRHFHHIDHWTKGGPTNSHNLVGLCWDHHHLVHEGGWTIDGNADSELTFTSPFGRRRCSRPRPLDPEVRRRAQDASGVDLHSDRDDLPPTGSDPPR